MLHQEQSAQGPKAALWSAAQPWGREKRKKKEEGNQLLSPASIRTDTRKVMSVADYLRQLISARPTAMIYNIPDNAFINVGFTQTVHE